MKPTLLVLAAGLGSRYGSLKQIEKLGPSGETIIDYSVYDAIRAGFGKVVFVIRKSIEDEFRNRLLGRFSHGIAVDYVLQEVDFLPEGCTLAATREKPWGTGHAVWVAAGKIQEPFAVINADDYYGLRSFRQIAEFLSKVEADHHCMVGFRLSNTLSEHGHVSRGICQVDEQGYLLSVTERTNIFINARQQIVYENEQGEQVPLTGEEVVSMNLMGFSPTVFSVFEEQFRRFLQEYGHETRKEFYLPSVVNAIVQQQAGRVKVLTTPERWFGVTYQEDKTSAQAKFQQLVADGIYPLNLWEPNHNTSASNGGTSEQ